MYIYIATKIIHLLPILSHKNHDFDLNTKLVMQARTPVKTNITPQLTSPYNK